jgi:DNA-binding beta-propeller fold protein YncE
MPTPGSAHRRRVLVVGGVVLLALIGVITLVDALVAGPGRTARTAPPVTAPPVTAPDGTTPPVAGPGPEKPSQTDPAAALLSPLDPNASGYLAPGSNPSVLPGPVLIADKLNNRLIIVDPSGRVRWTWPGPGDLAPGQTFVVPDDAFFSPDGRYIVATQEDDFVITVIDIATRKIVWRYGHPGIHGSGAGYLWNPDDATMLPNGVVVSADIKNCRIIMIPGGGAGVAWQEGTVGSCMHDPPGRFGSPNGVFPEPNGHFLVTEINGAWVDEIDTSGHVFWMAHPPSVYYPSDSNQVAPDQYLTVDYSLPGQVVIFDHTGKMLWRYAPTTGPGELDHPSLGVALPNGDVLLNDDFNHRVVVIDPRTDQIVWQYGHDGVAGSAPGYLDNPDGLDLMPPYSFADRNAPGQ